MRVLFVEPAKFFAEESMNKIIKQTPHIGLAYLVTATARYGHEVQVLDISALEMSLEEYLEEIKRRKPDVVAFTAMTHNVLEAYTYINSTVANFSDLSTILGGPHTNAVKGQVLKDCPSLKVAFVGEGEMTFPRVVEQIYRQTERSVIHGEITKNLDDLPHPDWSFFDYKKTYAKAYSYKFKEMRYVYPIQTMRGCPYKCVYCFPNGLGESVRFRSATSIFEEIQEDIETQNASFFYLADSNSTLHHKQMSKLCQMIIDEKLDIALKGETNINHVNRQLLTLMKKAGFELLFFGIESGSEYIQNKINKRLDLNKVRRVVKLAKEIGLKVRAGFILALPYETIAHAQQTIKFAQSLPLDSVIFSFATVYPNTQFEAMVDKGEAGLRYVNDRKPRWDEIGRLKIGVEVNNLTEDVQRRLLNDASHIISEENIEPALHKFLTEFAYYYRHKPAALERHIRNGIGLIETALGRVEN